MPGDAHLPPLFRHPEALELVQELTEVPEDPLEGFVDAGSKLYHHALSNDRGQRQCYVDALSKVPDPAPGRLPTAVVVGDGSVETIGQLLPATSSC